MTPPAPCLVARQSKNGALTIEVQLEQMAQLQWIETGGNRKVLLADEVVGGPGSEVVVVDPPPSLAGRDVLVRAVSLPCVPPALVTQSVLGEIALRLPSAKEERASGIDSVEHKERADSDDWTASQSSSEMQDEVASATAPSIRVRKTSDAQAITRSGHKMQTHVEHSPPAQRHRWLVESSSRVAGSFSRPRNSDADVPDQCYVAPLRSSFSTPMSYLQSRALPTKKQQLAIAAAHNWGGTATCFRAQMYPMARRYGTRRRDDE